MRLQIMQAWRAMAACVLEHERGELGVGGAKGVSLGAVVLPIERPERPVANLTSRVARYDLAGRVNRPAHLA